MRIGGRRQRKERAAAVERGHRLLVAQEEQEAFEFLEEAVERFPDDPEIRVLYASILVAVRPDAVVAEAVKATELGPDDPGVLLRAGQLMLGRGAIEGARTCAVRAREVVEPGFILESGLVNLEGRLAAIEGEDDLAEEKLRQAAAEDPNFSTFAIDLARFLGGHGRRREAVAVVDTALETCRMKEGLAELRTELLAAG